MIRLQSLNKMIFIIVLLTLFSSQWVCAESRLYRSDNTTPFVKMMLSMMSAMGMLDKVPGYGGYGFGGYGPYGSSFSPWGQYTNNPFQRSPWLQSPWLQHGQGGVSPVWGSPDWGLLPTHDYSYGYSPYGYGYTPYGTRWSSTDLDGWVEEPWEVSEWNPDAELSNQAEVSNQVSAQQQAVPLQPQTNAETPIVQNFNFNVAEEERLEEKQHRKSPLAKIQQPHGSRRQSDWQQSRPPVNRGKQPELRQKSNKRSLQEKPCITDFCGLKKPNMNGLWVAQDGEMLGIKNQRYLWSDGESRYLTGQLKVQNEYLLASVDGSEKLMRFKYKLAGNHLLTMQQDGTIREFMRKPHNPYPGRY